LVKKAEEPSSRGYGDVKKAVGVSRRRKEEEKRM